MRAFMILFCMTLTAAAQAEPVARDLNKVVGPEKCGECHKDEVAVWRETHHYKSFYDIARSEDGRKIATNMGVKRIKKDSVCVACHFLSGPKDGKIQPISGVACESCHTPAKDWIKVHNDYGGKDVKKAQETPAHKAERLRKIAAAGMIGPNDIYELANNCYGCHLVPNEKLVNVGGHKAGSDFELVAWSQGEIRHNFLSSPSGKVNLEAPVARKRLMFVVGHTLELQHSLRGVAKATQKDKYAVAMAKRAKAAAARVQKLATLIKVPELDQMVKVASGVQLKLNNEAQLLAAADKIAAASKRLAAGYDGSAWGALDKYLPKETKGHPAK
jgi:hypothetical protein